MKTKKRGRRLLFKKIFTVFTVLLSTGVAFVLIVFFYYSRHLPSLGEIANRQVAQSTKIFDRTGEVLLYEISNGERRTVIPLVEIPQSLKNATIAVEDERFYEEPAFDWKGIARAVWVNLTHREIRQGGSTITQQLARNAFLTLEQTWTRKIKELILAIQLGRYYTKDQILELYLNEIAYGPTVYGVEAASQAYFGKPTKDLALAESAILAAIPKAPTYYSPWSSHHKELFGRQRFILEKLLALGKITEQEFQEAISQKPSFLPQSQGIKAPHFVMTVQDVLAQKYGEGIVRTGGLRVITTLDIPLQELAEKVVKEGSESNEKLYQGKNAALVAEDPKTGQILALVGSRDYFDIENDGNFNVATQGLRQPGSALKPFAYLTAFMKGLRPSTALFDVPTEFAAKNPLCPPQPDYTKEDKTAECFHPQNFDEVFRGPVSLREALAQSINIPAVKVLYLAGLRDTLNTLHSFGITTLNDANRYGLSLVLGGGEVKLLDLVGAYSVLAQEGVKHKQTFILEVRAANGEVLESYRDQAEVVVDSQHPRLVNDILSDTDARAKLYQNSLHLTIVPDRNTALKTGTSNDYRDAWTVGYAPNLVAGVWAGNNDNTPMQRRGSSILAALPIWHAFMAEALKTVPLETFNRPAIEAPSKPILDGVYVFDNQVHSILYYINPKNILGPAPEHPENDPQFENWEAGVRAWVENNPSYMTSGQGNTSFIQTNQPTTQFLSVTISEPSSGTYIGNQITVSGAATAARDIARVVIYFNKQPVKQFDGNLGTAYHFGWSFTPPAPQLQNLIEVVVFDKENRSAAASVIVYK